MKLFSLDSPLMRFLTKMADLIIINLYTVLLCIPLITAGAAFTALHYCTLKIVRDQEVGITKQYFHSFKENFRQATIIWVLFLFFAALVTLDYIFMYSNPTGVSGFVFGGLIVVSILIFFVGSMVFPILSKFANTIPGTVKSAFVLAFRRFPATLLILIANAAPVLLFLFLPNVAITMFPIILCFCFSAPALLAALLNNKPFRKAEEAYLAEHPQEDPSAGDEHIFSDEPVLEEKNAESVIEKK